MAIVTIRTTTSFSTCFVRTEYFKQCVRRTTPSSNRRTLNTTTPSFKHPDFAFAFDIDGVLLRSSKALPRAHQSLAFLQRNRIPFILLTNGGGKHEEDRVSELSHRLGVPLDTSMFVQSHTPFAELVQSTKDDSETMKDKCILVVGGEGDNCRKVAENYGFTNVLSPADIIAACPHIMPFAHVSNHASYARPLPKQIQDSNNPPQDPLKIDAIFIFNDSRDWALDIQIILDLLLSHAGILGTISPLNQNRSLPNCGYQQDNQPPLYFSNPDLLWAAKYHLPRLGQGGFREALEGVWNAVTGGKANGVELQKKMFGKPHQGTFEFAERRLAKHRKILLNLEEEEEVEDKDPKHGLNHVYMVGDNPESDILGANSYNSPHASTWHSILVRSGVYRNGTPVHEPKVIVDDVWDAVQWGLSRSRW